MRLYLQKFLHMVRRLAVFFLVVLCSFRLLAIEAIVSHTVFYMPGVAANGKFIPGLDLCWQVNPATLHYATTPDKMIVANIKADVTFIGDTGTFIHDRYIIQTVPRATVEELKQQTILELRKYKMAAGPVKIKLVLTDMADSFKRFTYTDSFFVAPVADSVFFSGIQLLDTSFASNAATRFYKNGKQLIPFCTNFLDDGMNSIKYYAELYGADKLRPASFPLVRKMVISKSEAGGFWAGFVKTDTILAPSAISPLEGKFDIAALPSGNYYLRLTLESFKKQTLAQATLFFQRLNKHPQIVEDTTKKAAVSDTGIENVTVVNLSKTFLAKYSLGQVRAILKMLLPLSDNDAARTINGFLKKPDEMYMRYYVYNYFVAINKKDPARAWKDFSSKIAAVNKLYNTHNTPGYETDRGFMYLRYGAPTDVITVENEQGALPYEIWQYDVLKQADHKELANAVFLFYKPSQLAGDFKLLHSNVTGERQDTQWRTSLYTSQNLTGSIRDTRAEQYIGDK